MSLERILLFGMNLKHFEIKRIHKETNRHLFLEKHVLEENKYSDPKKALSMVFPNYEY